MTFEQILTEVQMVITLFRVTVDLKLMPDDPFWPCVWNWNWKKKWSLAKIEHV